MFSCVRSNKHITNSYCSNFLRLSFLCFRKGTHGTDSDRTGISHFKVNSYSISNFEISFLCSFSILEAQPMDMLLGLDMLKKHQVAYFIQTPEATCLLNFNIFQCTIDLRKNCLMIGTTGTETKFLSENELPPCAR